MKNTKILLIVSTLLFGSCSEGTSHSGVVNHNQKEQKMVSTKSDKSNDNASSVYKLQFNNDLSRIKAGDYFTLSFSPKYKYDDSKIVELETIHEQKAHLIIVSEDLEYFNHVHPTRVDNGEYSLQIIYLMAEVINYMLSTNQKAVKRLQMVLILKKKEAKNLK